MANLPTVVARFCLGMALIFGIVGMATPNFMTLEFFGKTSRNGLLYSCVDDDCLPYVLLVPYFAACQACGCVGILMLIIAAIAACVLSEDNKSVFAGGCALVAGVLFMITFAVFIGEKRKDGTFYEDSFNLGYSFVMIVVASILSFVSGTAFFCGDD